MRVRALSRLSSIVVLAGMMAAFAPVAEGSTIVIDFDTIDTSGGVVSGAPVTSYLAGFGISFSTSYAVGPYVEPYPYWMSPLSAPNSFGPVGLATEFFYTLTFSDLLDGLSFTRPGFNPAFMAAWSATAYSASDVVLATVGEGMTHNASPATFTLTGPGIDHVLFMDNGFSFAGVNFRMDNLTLTSADPAAVPEPASLTLLGLGLTGLRFIKRKRKS